MSTHRSSHPGREAGSDAPAAAIADLISPAGVVPALRASSKKQALQVLARRAAALTGQPEQVIFESLIKRERLGSTGIGDGIAIPHSQLPGLDRFHSLFARLDTPIDFDAVDGEPVDLIWLLLAPEARGPEHLRALAQMSRRLRDRGLREALRGAESADAIYALLAGSETDPIG